MSNIPEPAANTPSSNFSFSNIFLGLYFNKCRVQYSIENMVWLYWSLYQTTPGAETRNLSVEGQLFFLLCQPLNAQDADPGDPYRVLIEKGPIS
jgi:hypothetical protein